MGLRGEEAEVILTAHQPVFAPWLGFWHKLALADMYCVFNLTQYEKKSYENRNEIKTNVGKTMLSIPVESKNHFEKTIGDIKIVPGPWSRKHVRTIELAYAKAPYFGTYMEPVREVMLYPHERLFDLNLAFIRFGMAALGINIPVVTATDYDFQGEKSDLVLDMCRKLGATTYIFGAQGRDYADVPSFERAGIEVRFQAYQHPVYPQLHGDFISHLSFIDLLMNCGPESLQVLLSGNVTRGLRHLEGKRVAVLADGAL
jgi:hypothetical protein